MARTQKTPADSTRFSRRSLLQISAALAATAGISHDRARAQAEAQPAKTTDKRLPKNIIFLVSDGMSLGTLRLAELFAGYDTKRGTNWTRMMTDPTAVHGFFDMSSLNSCVSDSAAAASSWGSGSRVLNTWINTLPDGTKLTPISQIARSTGRRVGLVTTASITHATPAGFAVAQDKRNDEAVIAPMYLDNVDVLMGGGLKFFPPELRAKYAQSGYSVVMTSTELARLKNQPKILGLFSDAFMPYSIDRRHDGIMKMHVPSLADMTRAALASLNQSPKGFLIQIEGARIDHACHVNDAAALVQDQIAFDEAVGLAYEFATMRDDTLVVVTSDHGNANPGMMSMGPGGKDTNGYAENLLAASSSLELMSNLIKTGPKEEWGNTEKIINVFHKGTGATISAEQAKAFADALTGKRVRLHAQLDSAAGVYGQIMSNYVGVGFNCTQHTSDHTIITAIGPGADRFAGLIPNTQAFTAMTDLMGSPFKNPSMTAEDAAKKFSMLRDDPEQMAFALA